MKQSDLHSELGRLHAGSFGWALCCCDHRREEAEDVLQTAYLKVIEGRAVFGGSSSLRTWFFGVIRRTAMERRRRRWVREQLLEFWVTDQPKARPAPDPEQAASGSEEGRALLAALSKLPARQQEVLHLVFYQDLTVQEAAVVLKITLGTARTHFERGKAGLRRMLSEAEGKQVGRRT
jgi:RNA polymerase sigma-70 factor (ECF subfamily)